MTGVNHQYMNETNKFILLKTISTQGPVSRGELCARTGLSKMTVTTLIQEYISRGIVRECGCTSAATGRKPMLLEVVPGALLTLAASVGRDFLQVGIVNLTGGIVWEKNVAIVELSSNDKLLDALCALADKALGAVDRDRVWGIGVSSMGPLDVDSGVILNPHNFAKLGNIPVAQRLRERYGLPTYIENDMCVSALAELYFGNAKTLDNFLYVGVTAGIGGGAIVDRRLFSGAAGLAASIGHIVVEPDGIPCGCGQRGCLEMYASTRAVVGWARQRGAGNDLTWPQLLERAGSGDAICAAALGRMCRYLLAALTSAVAILDPQCIFLGGELQGADDIIERLGRALGGRLYARGSRAAIPVCKSYFPGNAAFIGAAALVMENNLVLHRGQKRI